MKEELRKELAIAIQSGQQKNVTNIRGRLINAYKKEIKELETKKEYTEEEKVKLSSLKEELLQEISEHKIQLAARYSNEVIREETSFSKIKEVPKNVGIAIEKVKACIEDLKLATTNKQRIFKALELAKSAGLVVATPIVYTGKIALKYWYVPFAMLSILKITDVEWLKNTPLESLRKAPVISQLYNAFNKISDSALEQLKNFHTK